MNGYEYTLKEIEKAKAEAYKETYIKLCMSIRETEHNENDDNGRA